MADGGDVLSHGVVRGELLLQQFGVGIHHREDVVEIVRETAGEHAQRFHFLALPQAIGELGGPRDVVRMQQHGTGLRIVPAIHDRERQLPPSSRHVVGDANDQTRLLLPRGRERLAERQLVVRMHERQQRPW